MSDKQGRAGAEGHTGSEEPYQAHAELEDLRQLVPRLRDLTQNRELIAWFNRGMLELFRAVTPPGGFLHVVDPDLNHTGYRFFPHVPLEAGATLEQWWGFVEYLQGAVWTVPLLPDGDSYYFVSPTLEFGFLSIYSVTGPSEIIFAGEPLCRALRSPDLPELLLRVRAAGTT
jgi:hypothetical protein